MPLTCWIRASRRSRCGRTARARAPPPRRARRRPPPAGCAARTARRRRPPPEPRTRPPSARSVRSRDAARARRPAAPAPARAGCGRRPRAGSRARDRGTRATARWSDTRPSSTVPSGATMRMPRKRLRPRRVHVLQDSQPVHHARRFGREVLAADLRARERGLVEQGDRPPALGQQDRGGAARRPAADDHDVDHDLARTAQNRKITASGAPRRTPTSPARSQSPLTSSGVYERLHGQRPVVARDRAAGDEPRDQPHDPVRDTAPHQVVDHEAHAGPPGPSRPGTAAARRLQVMERHRGDREVHRPRADRQRERVAAHEADLGVSRITCAATGACRVAVQREDADAPALPPRPAHQRPRDVPCPCPTSSTVTSRRRGRDGAGASRGPG